MADLTDVAATGQDLAAEIGNLASLTPDQTANLLLNQQAFSGLLSAGTPVLYASWAAVPEYIRAMGTPQFLAAVTAKT
ncbi:MAG TPA: hypothetical protein VHN99_12395, partial [Deinococcales bacterium]|nr:hypothetical protein [Deinococcales bacterium]